MSAKTNANIEDLFNRIIDDLQASTKKKETQPNPPNPGQGEPGSAEQKPEKAGNIKLNPGKGGPVPGGNCCQK